MLTMKTYLKLWKRHVYKLNDIVTLCGDFNFPGISWPLHEGSKDTESLFLDTVDDSNLIQHVKEFTRKRGTDNPSLLDLVLTDDQQVVSKPLITDPLGKSDHSVVCWQSTFRCYKDENEPTMSQNLIIIRVIIHK